MPCRDYDDSVRIVEDPETRRRLDHVTRMLCGLLQQLEEKNLLSCISGNITVLQWWKDHQAADRKRLEAEAAARLKQKHRAAALAKLTPAERKLLGV